jgi:hypothetical protein
MYVENYDVDGWFKELREHRLKSPNLDYAINTYLWHEVIVDKRCRFPEHWSGKCWRLEVLARKPKQIGLLSGVVGIFVPRDRVPQFS